MTDNQRDILNTISTADMCTVISSREQAYNDDIRRLRKENVKLKFIIKRLLVNRPNTYSGTDVMTNQAKIFAFDRAVKDAIEYLKEEENK